MSFLGRISINLLPTVSCCAILFNFVVHQCLRNIILQIDVIHGTFVHSKPPNRNINILDTLITRYEFHALITRDIDIPRDFPLSDYNRTVARTHICTHVHSAHAK